MPTKEELNIRADVMRASPTYIEQAFSSRLDKAGIKHLCQVVIEPFIVDFLIPSKRLIIEVDGKFHEQTKERDERRDKYLRNLGFKVIRIKSKDIWRFNLYKLSGKRRRGISRKQKQKWLREKRREENRPSQRDHTYTLLDKLDDIQALKGIQIPHTIV